MSAITATEPAAVRPIAQSERIQILDLLRGFAIFGILAVNMAGFASPVFLPGYVPPAATPWYDELAATLVLLLAEGKFYTIFAFLFGLGFSVQLARATAKGADFRAFYARRLAVLFGFGIIHALIWTGDILRLYAVLGFALLLCRGWSNRALLIGAAVSYGLSFALLVLIGGPNGDAAEVLPGLDLVALARAAHTSPAILEFIQFQAALLPFSFLAIAVVQGLSVLALFMLGLAAGRLALFERLANYRAELRRGLLLGLAGGLPLAGLLLAEAPWLSSLGFALGAPALAAAYISGLALLSLTRPGAALLAPLANVGRMALSNYVLHSAVCVLLFNGFGLGWYEQVGAAGLLGLTVAIYLTQIPLSGWWLARWRYGPLEWAWRSLAYGRAQPFGRR